MREDLRGSFTLAFDCETLDVGIRNMINEPMMKYYLSKTFDIDKSKFRFLRSESFFDSSNKDQKILKLLIEVVAEDKGKLS